MEIWLKFWYRMCPLLLSFTGLNFDTSKSIIDDTDALACVSPTKRNNTKGMLYPENYIAATIEEYITSGGRATTCN